MLVQDQIRYVVLSYDVGVVRDLLSRGPLNKMARHDYR